MIIKVDLQALNSLQKKALNVKSDNKVVEAPKLLQLMKRTFAVINGTNDKALITSMKYYLYNPLFKFTIDYKHVGFRYSLMNKDKGLVTKSLVYRYIHNLDNIAHNIYKGYYIKERALV